MEPQSLVTIYVTGQTHHVEGATNAPPVLLLSCCNCVVDGGLNAFPCSTCFLMSFQRFFIDLFSFHPFHVFVVDAHMTS